ncbi:membrane protein [Desulfuromonas versatilis]|uniref:Membrane protein n=1 Tax=Desulfuromonas versatilis TaxID=2802975 RepID=A0ABM8HZQ4_9BACT|nr:bestrophin family ion channel [Desulfuromonas versatilis]BCR06294.1 membrane protein [Desulfuromonas versatilis]
MIVCQRPSGLRLFFTYRGSILQQIKAKLLVTMLLALAVTLTHGTLFRLKITMTPVPFSLIGIALAIFLGFRNSASYDRYWEGRKLWGQLVITSRNLCRQILTFVDTGGTPPSPSPLQRKMVYRVIAFTHALRHHLRESCPKEDLAPLLPANERERTDRARNKPNFILESLGNELRRCLAEKRTHPYFAASLDQNLDSLAGILGGCERIKNTPIPFAYTLLVHRTAYLYCFLLPFGLVDSLGFMTPFVVGIISYTFFGLDALGDALEQPFGLFPNDLPLTAIALTIEGDLREALGESDLPKPPPLVGDCLQ